ncbi:MAG: peptide chain release factor N(5)-glutamine methyltransferase [Gammaproteobacteria bacterium]|nr:peptide chain release factor N(5)-glutamine methyltransferase [Gammaproteobacteria bacterium]MDH5323382.1 peptide chain release factor N(5)-glutamine methyltransferase [Gammaproteobacteria bacterium]
MPSTTKNSSIAATIADASARLRECGDSARLDAEMLVARAIDMPRSYLFAHPEESMDEFALARLEASIARRLSGLPMAYITGVREFWSLELQVSPATLVPRPETELLVELALREIPRRADWRILDLGTGSGAIAVAVARERPGCRLTAVDRSADALAIAKLNVRALDLGNVECLLGDWIAPVAGAKFQLIVSNPPYVAAGDAALAALAAEPELALVSGSDGLDAIRRLSRDCPTVLVEGGLLILEHGNQQRDAVAAILASDGWRDIRGHDDYAGRPRATTARF